MNITDDSFFDGGRYNTFEKALERGIELANSGADVIDIGGESTRPGAEPVPLELELKRVIPVIKELSRIVSVPISIDTYKSEVAKQAIDAGASIVNDISGLRFDPNMPYVIKETKVSFVLMHIKGTPKDMQLNPYYENTVEEIKDYFRSSLEQLEMMGIDVSKAIIDVGIGFGKRVEDNILLLRHIDEFKAFGLPILVGTSRKSFIGKLLGDVPPSDRLVGSLATYAWLYFKRVDHIRVHDVKETAQLFKMLEAIEYAV